MRVEDLREQETVVEAVLFTMGQSVEIRQLAAALETGESEAEAAAMRLKERYDAEGRAMQIVRLEESFQMCTRAVYYGNLIKVAATPKKQVLTDVVLETLAIIAYKQPVTKADIEKIRGVKSDHAVNRLIEYNLVYEAGRLDAPGRPALFATTEEFLRRFGVSSTVELPEMDMEQREEIRTEVEEELNLKLDADGKLVDTELEPDENLTDAEPEPDGRLIDAESATDGGETGADREDTRENTGDGETTADIGETGDSRESEAQNIQEPQEMQKLQEIQESQEIQEPQNIQKLQDSKEIQEGTSREMQ